MQFVADGANQGLLSGAPTGGPGSGRRGLHQQVFGEVCSEFASCTSGVPNRRAWPHRPRRVAPSVSRAGVSLGNLHSRERGPVRGCGRSLGRGAPRLRSPLPGRLTAASPVGLGPGPAADLWRIRAFRVRSSPRGLYHQNACTHGSSAGGAAWGRQGRNTQRGEGWHEHAKRDWSRHPGRGFGAYRSGNPVSNRFRAGSKHHRRVVAAVHRGRRVAVLSSVGTAGVRLGGSPFRAALSP